MESSLVFTRKSDKVVEKHRSGEGYKKILMSLIIPLSTVKSIIKKWKTYHTTQTLPRSGRPSKLSSRASRKLVWDVTVNPAMILKDLQGSMSEMGISVHQSTISPSLQKADLHGLAARNVITDKDGLCQKTSWWYFTHLWSDETKIELFGLNSKPNITGASLPLHITQSTPSLLSSMVVVVSCYGAAFHQ